MVVEKIFRIFLLVVATKDYCCSCIDSKEWIVNLGENILLPCYDNLSNPHLSDFGSVMWVKSGKEEKQLNKLKILPNGSLSINNVIRSDAGEYMCKQERDEVETEAINGKYLGEDDVRIKHKVFVRTPPSVLVNVTVHPSTVLALLLWDVGDTGGCDISYFCAQYKLKYDPLDSWHNILPKNISPSARQIDVYRLNPNSTYSFRIWAVNALGDGEATVVDATTNHMLEEIELARHLLEGAESFDTRIWVVAVGVVMGTLIMLSAGTCYIFCRECNFSPFSGDDQEVIELVPHIILNPVFYETEYTTERIFELDENFNDREPILLNNNSVIRPVRL